MATGKELAEKSCIFLGCLYSDMDCQTFVEKALAEVGIRINLAGSNTWLREVMKNGWVGSPEECIRKFGCVPDGAFLFIHAFDGKEPSKYLNDGIGNASHIGIKTGLTGEQMVDLAGTDKAKNYNLGDGAIHSSYSREHVVTSNFKGKSINGGWNKVGLWNKLDFGEKINAILKNSAEPESHVVVWAKSGETVNMRKSDSKLSKLVIRVPVGAKVQILKQGNKWTKVSYADSKNAVWYGWIMTEFLKGSSAETVTLCIPLPKEQAEELMKKYPGSWIK